MVVLHLLKISKSNYYKVDIWKTGVIFIKKTTVSSAALSIGGTALGFSAKSYGNIIGSNDKIHVAAIGLNGRGNSMVGTIAKQKNTEVTCVCDVDSRTIPKAIESVKKAGQENTPSSEKDCRKVLENKIIDAIYIATPDHWHAPLTIMGCQAGKHVYVEKPLSHNPREGELAIEAARKYDRIVQMGSAAPFCTCSHTGNCKVARRYYWPCLSGEDLVYQYTKSQFR